MSRAVRIAVLKTAIRIQSAKANISKMCILACGLDIRNDFPLVVLHLRDEHISRETLGPSYDDPIIAAKDTISGGSFMGFNVLTGAFAALTNVRLKGGAQPPQAASRGKLVQSILERNWEDGDNYAFPQSLSTLPSSDSDPALRPLGSDFASFNLLCGRICVRKDACDPKPLLQLISNRSWLPRLTEKPSLGFVSNVPAGRVTCFSNGTLSARWRKINWFRDAVSACIAKAPHAPSDGLESSRKAARLLFESMQAAVLQHHLPFDEAELAACEDEADIALSELPELAERRLRRHVFLPPPSDPSQALEPTFLVTRSLSAVIVTGELVHYFYLDTTGFPALGPLFHRTIAVPRL